MSLIKKHYKGMISHASRYSKTFLSRKIFLFPQIEIQRLSLKFFYLSAKIITHLINSQHAITRNDNSVFQSKSDLKDY